MTKDTPKLKIAFVLDDGLDQPDGVQQNILTLGNWLTDEGHEVHYLVGETKRTDIKNAHPLAKNIKIHFNGNKLTIPIYAPKKNIKKILSREKFDVLHVQMPYHPFCGACIVKAANSSTAIVGTFHILEYGLSTRFGTKLLGLYLRRNLKKFDHFMSVSEPARKFAKQSFKIDSTILPNPVEVAKFKPLTRAERDPKIVRLIFVGRLVPRKGCLRLIESINLIKTNNEAQAAFHLDICGDGQLRSSLEDYVRRHDLESVVTFRGFVSEKQKVDLLQQADIAIFPSSGGESFGIVLIEAMAAKSTVLGGDNPGYHSVLASIPESLFDPNSTEELAAKLLALINNSAKRLELHKKQQKLVKQFDVNVIGNELVRIYRDCIDAKKH